MLQNETYTGISMYRRTSVQKTRDPRTGRTKRKVELRDPADWIQVQDATPAIVDNMTFGTAQKILDDPERRRRGKRKYHYGLSGRIKCLKCGKAMVGQTLKKSYRYYKCRRLFAGPRHDRCDTTYVRADALEQAVKEEMALVLANPEMIIAEHQRLRGENVGERDRVDLQSQADNLDGQRQRLLKLYQLGEIDYQYLEVESRSLRAQMADIESRMKVNVSMADLSLGDLEQACARVRQWVQAAEEDEFALLADAFQIRVLAEKGRGELTGVIPEYAPDCSHADVCSVVINFMLPQGSSSLYS